MVTRIKMVYIFELKQIFLSVWTILNAMGTGNEGFKKKQRSMGRHGKVAIFAHATFTDDDIERYVY